ncbi:MULTISPECIES: type IV pilus modification protein PilV [unclassified Pseudoalteromonas]|uniref:type IV pilus modification protein PilV n=1 Tax=unclassified Pseudoalteromonas TaxID=194690 RepID=UPI000CF6EA61|nr:MULTISPECIES: type IV pilus modification protein PilV [unclassified Pseudoalteromonas]MBS3796228.1 type IV pilus modification protein PilV [Pseudoalteromonas sp. BDTF-M6]
MRHQQGFTLLETLIAFIVLVFGLLGAIALQAKAKQATYDAMQRAAALGVANDVIERMKANTEGALAGNYNGNIASSDTPPEASSYKSCINNGCSAAEVALFDKEHWRKSIRGVDATGSQPDNTGSLSGAMICIDTTNGGADNRTIKVTISWDSRQELTSNAGAGAVKADCGTNDDRRRVLALNSFLFV